jgi:hypothetical protein
VHGFFAQQGEHGEGPQGAGDAAPRRFTDHLS